MLKWLIKEKGLEYLDSSYGSIVKSSALAILMHHYEQINEFNVSLGSFPLLGLLIICDEIQEWNRPGSKDKIRYKLKDIESIEGTSECGLRLVVTMLVKGDELSEEKIIENVKKVLNAKKERLDLVAGFYDERAPMSLAIQLNVVYNDKVIYSITVKDLVKGAK